MLTGTEKQIRYAEKVKSYVLFQLSTIDAGAIIKAIEKIKKAEVILDAFVDMFKCKNVKTKVLEFLTWEKKEKYTQKDILAIKNRGITIDEVADAEFEGYEKQDTEVKVKKEETKIVAEVKKASEKQINGMRIEMIDKKVNLRYSNKTPNYFTAKYDTFDSETGERISAGELVWKDSEGIHRADNW